MSVRWEIGEEARELDEKPISERLKVERSSRRKIGITLFCYSLIMVFFYFFL